MKEAHIGSLPWFAGVFWLTVATLFHTAAHAVFDLRVSNRLCRWLIQQTNRCTRLANSCAFEAGAEE